MTSGNRSWEEDLEGCDICDKEHLEREWKLRREGHRNAGYREGLEAGKKETVQAGFDAGASDKCFPSINY